MKHATLLVLTFLLTAGLVVAEESPDWSKCDIAAPMSWVFRGHQVDSEVKSIDEANHTVEFHVGTTAWSRGSGKKALQIFAGTDAQLAAKKVGAMECWSALSDSDNPSNPAESSKARLRNDQDGSGTEGCAKKERRPRPCRSRALTWSLNDSEAWSLRSPLGEHCRVASSASRRARACARTVRFLPCCSRAPTVPRVAS
jgi:hypothetical protein